MLGAGCAVAVRTAFSRWYRRELLAQGMHLVTEHRCLPAVRVLQRAVALTPSDARAHYYLGIAYVGIGKYGSSLAHLHEAMRLASDDTRIREGFATRAPGHDH